MVVSSVLADNSMNFNENPQGNAILDMLREQRNDGRFCDIVLHVSSSTHQGKLFPAHRSVLAACSQYFESVLKTHRVTKEQINIGLHDVDVFQTLLDYMYTGNITVDWNNVNELLKLSNYFLMPKVTNYCTDFLEHYMAVDNCICVKDLAEKYTLETLTKTANDFITDNLTEVIEQPFIIEMTVKKLDALINDQSVGFNNLPVSQLLTFFVSWVKKDVQRRSSEFSKLLRFIDWNKMKTEFIYDHIDTETLYRESKACLYFTLKSLNKSKINIDKYNKLYFELRKKIAGNDVDESLSEGEMIVPENMNDDDEEDLLSSGSPIIVEPVEVLNVQRTRSKTLQNNNKERVITSKL